MLTLEAILLLAFGLAFGRLTQLPGLEAYLSAGGQEYYWALTAQRWAIDIVTLAGFLTLLGIANRQAAKRWGPRVIGLTIAVWIAVVMGRHILIHQASQPGNLMHDGTLQTEVAARFLLRGQNPYTANYQGTLFDFAYSSTAPLENSAFTHLVYPPGMLALAIPFVWLADASGTFVELPVLYVGLAILASLLLVRRLSDPAARSRAMLLTIGNPLIMLYPIAGYNDLAVAALLVLTALLTWRRRWVTAGLVFGLAVATKQLAWVAAPLWLVWLWSEQRHDTQLRTGARRAVLAALAVTVLMYGPFLIWNAPALIEDLVVFPAGTLLGAYPIAGSTLWQLKAFFQGPDHVWDLVPSGWISALVGAAAVVISGRWLHLRPGPSRWLIGVATSALALGLTHRFFHDNYLMAIVFVLIAAYVSQPAEQRD